MAAKPIPEGYSTVTPFLTLQNCIEAMEFYKKAFGAEERARMLSPDGKVMHAELKIGNSIVMFSEAMMNPPTKSSLHIYVENCDAWWKRATEAGCKVEMPLEDAFWGDRYGVLSDKWGNRWGIATHKEDISPDEMKRRGEAFMKNAANKK